MSDPAISERRIRPVQDAIAAANWRQALQLCNKWLQKGESSERFLALRATVLVNQADPTNRDRGVIETRQLCNRSPAITDAQALHQIQDTLRELSLNSEAVKLWDRAVSAKPDDKDLLMTWLNRSVAESNWLSAQKATMALRKAFLKDRNYEFWNILMCYLISKDVSVPGKERILFGTLAYRLISKAVEAVPEDKHQMLSPGKAIQTPEELHLLVKIYLDQGQAAEAVRILRSDQLGLQSRFAAQDPQLILSSMLEAIERSQQWSEALALCEDLLANPKYGALDPLDDDRIWQLLLKATTALEDTGGKPRALESIEMALRDHTGLRSAQNAKMALLQGRAKKEGLQGALLEACQKYYDQFGSKAFCFGDLREPTNVLNYDTRKRFLEHTRSAQDTAGTVKKNDTLRSLLQLDLQFNLEIGSSHDPAVVHSFTCEALQLYHESLANKKLVPEAGILAAVALIHAIVLQKDSKSAGFEDLTKVAILLDICCRRSEDCYPALVLLLRVQLALGLISSAMMSFKKLSVKNMQWETVGHMILTRISTLHPWQYGKIVPSHNGGYNPLEALDLTMTVAENTGRHFSRGIMDGLKCGSYVNVANTVQMSFDMKNSINSMIAAIEEKRVQRLRGIFEGSSVPSRPAILVDRRDFSYLTDFAAPGTAVFDRLRCGPLPQETWLDSMILYDDVFSILQNENQAHPVPLSSSIEHLRSTLSKCIAHSRAAATDMTDVEIGNFVCHRLVAEASVMMLDGSSTEQSKLHGTADEIEQWLRDHLARSTEASTETQGVLHLADLPVPGWEYVHAAFSDLETLQLLTLFTSVVTKKAKKSKLKTPIIPKQKIMNLQRLIKDIQTRIQKDATNLKQNLSAPGVLGVLVEVALGRSDQDRVCNIGREIERIADEAMVEMICGEMKESWEDALDGILNVKIKEFG